MDLLTLITVVILNITVMARINPDADTFYVVYSIEDLVLLEIRHIQVNVFHTKPNKMELNYILTISHVCYKDILKMNVV